MLGCIVLVYLFYYCKINLRTIFLLFFFPDERNDAEEVTMSKIIKDLFNISVCLVFNFIDSEKRLKNFKKLTMKFVVSEAFV